MKFVATVDCGPMRHGTAWTNVEVAKRLRALSELLAVAAIPFPDNTNTTVRLETPLGDELVRGHYTNDK